MDPHPGHVYSSPMRTAAASARGASVAASTAIAASRYMGAACDSPAIASAVARAPKISTGTDSGNTSSASSEPLRLKLKVKPAPTAPIKLNATVPSSTAASMPGSAAECAPSVTAASGATSTSGSPVSNQCTTVLASRSPANDCPHSAHCSSAPYC